LGSSISRTLQITLMAEPAKKKPKILHTTDTGYRSKKRKRIEVSQEDEFLLLLAKTKVDDLGPKRQIVTAYTADTLPEAFTKMINNKILSLPVLTFDGEYHGYIDILDIVTWLVDRVGEENILRKKEYKDIIDDFKVTTVDTMVIHGPYVKRNPYHAVEAGSSLLTAVEILARGVHRVPIVEGDALVNIITQTTVINWIKSNWDKFGKKDVKVADMDCFSWVLFVYDSEKAIDAFRLMKLAKVGAVAICNDAEKLVGSISLRDIKKISGDAKYFSRLFDTVTSFRDKRRLPHVTVTEDNTLTDVLNLLEKHNIHRVYIVDKHDHAIGVISLTDILAAILPNFEKP